MLVPPSVVVEPLRKVGATPPTWPPMLVLPDWPEKPSPASEPLYTTNPFAEQGLGALFDSHPPVDERVKRLRELDPNWRSKLAA